MRDGLLSPLLLGIVALPLLSLFFRPFKRTAPWSFKKAAFALVLLDMGLVLGTLLLDRPGSACAWCRPFSREGLLLSLSLIGDFLPYLLTEGEEPREEGLPGLLAGVLSSAIFALIGPAPLAGGAFLAGVLLLSALYIAKVFPGAYRKPFFIRLGAGAALLALLSLSGKTDFSGSGLLAVLSVSASLLLLPAPFPRRTERVSRASFLRVDQALFVLVPPVLVFHVLGTVLASGPETPLPAGYLIFFLLLGLSGLLYGKTALFSEDLACGMTTAGTGLALAGLLTRSPDGEEGALFLVLLLPLTTALSGLVLSMLAVRYRGRTFDALSGKGSRHDLLRLAFYLGAFQGMGLPLVGAFSAEWPLLKALMAISPLIGAGAVAGLFFAFVLLLNRAQRLFMGDSPQSLSASDLRIADEVTHSEKWSLGIAFGLLLLFDLVLSLTGGRGA